MRKRIALMLAVGCLLFSGCSAASSSPSQRSFTALDTACSVKLYDAQSEELLTACVDTTAHCEALWSRTMEQSDIARLNSANGDVTAVSAETAALLDEARLWHERTDGAFDMTITAYKTLWEQANGTETPPSAEALSEASALVGTDKLTLDGTEAQLANGAEIDLGAIAKGAVADKLCKVLREGGCTGAVIDLGGNITAFGQKPGGAAFHIGINDPFHPDDILLTVAVRDTTLSTSGSYERFFDIGGKRYSHILDPQTGQPVENDLMSVTILHENGTTADALSTACFVMGYDGAAAFLETVEGAEAVFVLTSGEVIATDGVTVV